jgi:RsiW-degrading membrane proteinase PrsW (M82 family)
MSVTYLNVLFATAIGIVPVTWWLWVITRKNHFGKENPHILSEVFLWGVLAAIPASVVEMIMMETGGGSMVASWVDKAWLFSENNPELSIFFLAGLIAMIEELSKFIGIIIIFGRHKIKNANDGLIIGLVVGLAFAVTENGVYFAIAAQARESLDFGNIIALRFILSTSAHVIYSGTAGLFLAKAKFAKGLKKYIFVLLAICLPISIHTLFNFLLEDKQSINSVIMTVVIGMGLFILGSELKENYKKSAIKIKRESRKDAKK